MGDEIYPRSLGDEAEKPRGRVAGVPRNAGLRRALGRKNLGGQLGPDATSQVGGGLELHRDPRSIQSQRKAQCGRFGGQTQ